MTTTQIIILILVAVAVLATIATFVINFINLPKGEKIKNVKEWLKYAVSEAEKALGSGTGQLKLRMVYDMAVKQFPWLVTFVKFEVFSGWVDGALDWMNLQLSAGGRTKDYIENKTE